VPTRRSKPGEAFVYGYRLLWQKDRETRPPLGWVSETRRGRGYAKVTDGSVELHVDFDGPTLTRMPPAAGVDLALWTDDNAEVVDRYVRRNDATGGWRAAVRFRRLDPARPVELRAHLIQANEVASETWTYILPPE
jgi:periplasmic glucans biosynthesis protein